MNFFAYYTYYLRSLLLRDHYK